MVNTKGIDQARVLSALYNASKPLGLGRLHFTPEDMKVEEAAELLESQTYFDYLKGRVMKVELRDENEFGESMYDRDNGAGAAQRVIDSLRE